MNPKSKEWNRRNNRTTCSSKVVCFFCLLISCVAAPAQFTFTTNNAGITITGYSGTGNSAAIPATTNGYPVVGIGANAFLVCAGLTSIFIPASVTNYAWPSFSDCTNLLAVYFQGSPPVDHYPAAPPVFANDANATLYYLSGTRGWPSYFDYTLPCVPWDPQVLNQLICTTNNGAITVAGYTGPGGAVTIPSTFTGLPVVCINSNAFQGVSSLTGITLPDTTTNLGSMAFAGCTGLTGVTVACNASGSGVFSNCTSLTNLTFSTGTTAVGASEFSGCTALASLIIPTNFARIGSSAFQNCPALAAVSFQGNAPVADTTVFSGDNVETNYYFPKTSGWGATFAGRPAVPILFTCTTNASAINIKFYIGLEGSVTIPATLDGMPVTSLGNTAFNGCNTVTNVLVSSNVTSIAGQAFVGCPNLLAINVDANNSAYSSINGVLFDKGQDTILYYPGGRAGSYTLPDGVTTIGTYAFQACSGLTTLIVPASVTNIETLAFNADGNLTAIYFEGDAPTVQWMGFDLSETVTAFYLVGTSNWDSNLGGLPIAIWLPQAVATDSSFGIRNNQFGFNINWAEGQNVVVEVSTNLAQPVWIPLATNTLSSNTLYFADPLWTNSPGRYYRVSPP